MLRDEAANRLRDASQPGDIEDNPEYEQAKEELARLDSRIYELEEMISRAQIIEEHHSTVVEAGSTVDVREPDGTIVTYHMVGAVESDPASGRISIESPVGRALIGRRRGESVEVNVPSGKLVLKIVKIH